MAQHHPSKVETRVQIPYPAPNATVVQLVERLVANEKVGGSSPLRRSDRGSSNGRTVAFGATNRGSNPRPRTQLALVAQLAEHPPLKRMVGGSIPSGRTKISKGNYEIYWLAVFIASIVVFVHLRSQYMW